MDSADRGHLTEAIGKVVELLDAMSQSYWKFLREELGGAEESACEGDGVSNASAHKITALAQTIQFSCIGNIPTEGFSPNWTICRRETPVAGNLAKWAIRS